VHGSDTFDGLDLQRARRLVDFVDIDAPHIRWTAPTAPDAPGPGRACDTAPGGTRLCQPSLKLRERDHDTLTRAAAKFCSRHGQPARMLQGASRMLMEEDAGQCRLTAVGER
jgi:hypothetical protein